MTAERKTSGSASLRAAVLCGLGVTAALNLAGCGKGSDDETKAQSPTYSAEIRRTSFGIPHVVASDHAGLGYGLGYAYAQDNICMFAEMMLTVNGERSRYFAADAVGGPDVETGSISSPNLQSDFFFKYLNSPQQVESAWNAQKPQAQALLKGYVAGYNRYLADTGADHLPVACRNAGWVRDITELDLIRLMRRLASEASSLRFMPALVGAQSPSAGEGASAAPTRPATLFTPMSPSCPTSPRRNRTRALPRPISRWHNEASSY